MVPLVGKICTICTNFFTSGTIGNLIGTNGTNVTTEPVVPLESPGHTLYYLSSYKTYDHNTPNQNFSRVA